MNRRALLAGAGAAAAMGAGAFVATRRPPAASWRGEGDCGPALSRADLDAAVALGADYLTTAQLPDGTFVYEVDWTTGQRSRDDNVVRQTGALWGLALLHADGLARVEAPLDRALAYWLPRQRSDAGRVWVVDGGARGQTGAMALIGLALVDRLAAPSAAALPEAARQSYAEMLDGVLAWVLHARLPAGGFASAYDPETGVPGGNPNPYADGEALLLLVKAARALQRPELLEQAAGFAVVDHRRNVEVPLLGEPDPDTTKGYYQWGSMSWWQLAEAGQAPERHGQWLTELAVWMIDVHRTLKRTRNTAYAYEGIVSAWDWAHRHGPEDVARKLACVGQQGLRKLFSWQLGHPLAPAPLRQAPDAFRGGVQNRADAPPLRIDVTQHQTHAAILARRYGLDTASP
ncbi:MAG: hypothetical protein R3F59_17020 [Myxococcota bacterium]